MCRLMTNRINKKRNWGALESNSVSAKSSQTNWNQPWLLISCFSTVLLRLRSVRIFMEHELTTWLYVLVWARSHQSLDHYASNPPGLITSASTILKSRGLRWSSVLFVIQLQRVWSKTICLEIETRDPCPLSTSRLLVYRSYGQKKSSSYALS